MISVYKRFIQTAINEYLVYRLNFILWRFRNVLNLILIYFLWTSIFVQQDILFGYSEQKIVTYILLVNICAAIVFSSKTDEVGNDILDGKIINHLLRPFSYFGYVASREGADKILNIGFALAEILLLILIARPEIYIQHDILAYVLFLLQLCLSVLISFFISFLLSLVAFWSADIWGPRFIYFVFSSLLSGMMFPLDVLPTWMYHILLGTPFPYLVYAPTKILIEGVTPFALQAGIMSMVWIAVLFGAARTLWMKGMREFSFFGR